MAGKSDKKEKIVGIGTIDKWKQKVDTKSEELIDNSRFKNGIISILVSNIYSNIGSTETVAFIDEAINKMYLDNPESKRYIISTGDAQISDMAFKAIVEMYQRQTSEKGLEIKFNTCISNFKKFNEAFGVDFNRFEVKPTVAKVEPIKEEVKEEVKTVEEKKPVIYKKPEPVKVSKAEVVKNTLQEIEKIRSAGSGKTFVANSSIDYSLPENIDSLSKEERKRVKAIANIITTFTHKHGIPSLQLRDKFENILSSMTSIYIIDTVAEIQKIKGYNRIQLDFTGVEISENCLEVLRDSADKLTNINIGYENSAKDTELFQSVLGDRYKQLNNKKVNYDIDTLEVVSVEQLLGVTNISSGNDKPWIKLLEDVSKRDKPANYDFKNMQLYFPLNSDLFKKLLANQNFYLTLYYKPELVNDINNAARLANYSYKAKNIEAIIIKEPTKEEKNIKRQVGKLNDANAIAVFSRNGHKVKSIHLQAVYTAIGAASSTATAGAFRQIIQDTRDNEPDIAEVELDFTGLTIEDAAVKPIIDVVKELSDDRLDVTYFSNDKRTTDKLDIELVMNNNYSIKDKVELLTKNLPWGKAGFMAHYKDSRALDKYGRQSDGTIQYACPAIYLGKSSKEGSWKAYFMEFNLSNFTTREDYYCKHDRAEITKPDMRKTSYEIDELGFGDMFLGSKGHFNPITQKSYSQNVSMSTFNEETGSYISKRYTIPERFKAVFDSFPDDVKYSKEELDKDIERIRKELDEASNKSGIFEASN